MMMMELTLGMGLPFKEIIKMMAKMTIMIMDSGIINKMQNIISDKLQVIVSNFHNLFRSIRLILFN